MLPETIPFKDAVYNVCMVSMLIAALVNCDYKGVKLACKDKLHQPYRINLIENYSDIEIWKYAKENNFTFITFDADFYDLSSLKEFPPKIIWLRFGNTKSDIIAYKINFKHSLIKEFINAREYSEIACLEINK